MGVYHRGVWSTEEHDRFLDAINVYPAGPWLAISKFIGTRSARQVQTHAQKYYEKIARRLRGLQRDRNASSGKEHRIEERILSLVAQNSPALELVKSEVSKIHRHPRRTDCTAAPEDAAPPPCLQRLRALPTSPVSVEQRVRVGGVKSEMAYGHATSIMHSSSVPLPSLEQSLDFLIDCFSEQDEVDDLVAHAMAYNDMQVLELVL